MSRELIKNSLQVFKSIFDHTKDLIFIKDSELKFQYTNPYLLRIFNIEKTDVVGKTYFELMTKESAEKNSAIEERVLSGTIERDEIVQEVDGKKRSFYIVRSPIYDEQKKIIGICGIAREITQLEETMDALHDSQQKLLAILQSTNVGINIIDIDGKYMFVNDYFIKKTGYTREEFLKLKINDITHPDDLKQSLVSLYQILNNEIDSTSFDKRYCCKDQSIFWANLSVSPLRDYNGNITALISIIADATDRKIAEESLINSERKLREVNDTKDKFFSIIAHDLRNPLGSLMNLSKMLKEDYFELTEEERVESIDYLHSASEAAYNLLEDLLNWSRAQTGNIEINKDIISIEKIVKDNILLCNSLIQNKEINVSFIVAEDIKCYADENMVSTVLRNLLTNAIKFTPIKGNITITAQKQSEETCLIKVTDDGIGISLDDVKKLFKIDKNFKRSGTMNEQGTGLGLILCKEFINLNGGKIWVESEEGKGSSFKFTLPMKND